MKTYDSISAYIEACPAEHQRRLEQLRAIIQKNVPTAQETISYGIPTFKLRGNLIHFGLAKKHIGLYPGAAAVEAFKESFAAYKTSKGAIQLPLEEELPIGLIEDILRFSANKVGLKASVYLRQYFITCGTAWILIAVILSYLSV